MTGTGPAIEKSDVIGGADNAGRSQQSDVSVSEYQSRLRRAAIEISLASERERREIAGDVHDNISQELAIANLRLSELCTGADSELQAALNEIRARVACALQACRALTYNLATPALYKLGLIPAVKNLISDYGKTHGLKFSADISTDKIVLPRATEVVLYRVIRELLVNVVKHAQAKSVKLSICRVGSQLRIAVADDGVGFDVASTEKWPPESGLGLFLLRERLWHLGGSFELNSAPGTGTMAILTAPCECTDVQTKTSA